MPMCPCPPNAGLPVGTSRLPEKILTNQHNSSLTDGLLAISESLKTREDIVFN